MKKIFLLGILSILSISLATAQEHQTESDTLEVEKPPLKLMHAEPLYIDLIRDLGARKGEREWNVGMGMTDRLRFDSYEFLVEYEWAVIDRLGLEIEVPVTIFTPSGIRGLIDESQLEQPLPERPSNRVESIKLAAQYTFLVSDKMKTSLALGAITELEFTDLNKMSENPLFQGVLYNPFFIAAKRWGNNFHTLLYTGPRITTHFGSSHADFAYEINSNFHYMIPESKNFVGLEVNKILEPGNFDMVIRPQMRLVINNELMVGIVPGISVFKERERMSAFMRLIYEPSHKP